MHNSSNVTKNGITRRTLLAGAAALGGALAAPTVLRAANNEVVFATWGGSWEAAMRKAWFEPFRAKTGIAVKTVSGNTYGKIEAMVTSGRTEWDVVESLSSFPYIGEKKGLLTPIDYAVVDKSVVANPDMITPYSIPQVLFSDVMTYSTKLDPAPKSWADIFDTKTYPGKRTFDGTQIATVIEAALLADGVAPSALYPIDVPRALKKLSTIRQDIQFYATNAQGQQYMSDGQCTIGMMPDGRALSIKNNGAPVNLAFGASIMSWTSLSILKGAPNASAAQKLLAYTLTPEAQAEVAKIYTYGPVVPKAMDLIPVERQNMLSGGPHMKGAVLRNEKWWSDNLAMVSEKFDAWKLG